MAINGFDNISYGDLADELINLIGIPTFEELPLYGITIEEFMNPTKEVISRVKNNIKQNASADVVEKGR